MKKSLSICLMMLLIVPCMMLFSACGNNGGNPNYNGGNPNYNDGNGGSGGNGGSEDTTPTPSAKYDISIIDGTGSGTYDAGQTVTITSNDGSFLWWQEKGKTFKLSTKSTYSFIATKNVTIVSHGTDRSAGFAVMTLSDADMAKYSDNTPYNVRMEEGTTVANSKAYINGTLAQAAVIETNGSGKGFGRFEYHGNRSRVILDKNSFDVCNFRVYTDIDGTIKALKGNFYSRAMCATITVTMPGNWVITYELK